MLHISTLRVVERGCLPVNSHCVGMRKWQVKKVALGLETDTIKTAVLEINLYLPKL